MDDVLGGEGGGRGGGGGGGGKDTHGTFIRVGTCGICDNQGIFVDWNLTFVKEFGWFCNVKYPGEILGHVVKGILGFKYVVLLSSL